MSQPGVQSNRLGALALSYTCKLREMEDQDMQISIMDHFPRDVTHMRKFDYYSADHTGGGGGGNRLRLRLDCLKRLRHLVNNY